MLVAVVLLAGAFLDGCETAPDGAIEPGAPRVSITDFAPILETSLRGALTYKDYGDGAPRTIPVDAALSASEDGAIDVALTYPDEPSENAQEHIVFSEDGRVFGGEKVIARIDRPDGGVDFVTSVEGEDDGAPAEIRFVYSIAACSFLVLKNVRLLTSEEFFERSRYELSCAGAKE